MVIRHYTLLNPPIFSSFFLVLLYFLEHLLATLIAFMTHCFLKLPHELVPTLGFYWCHSGLDCEYLHHDCYRRLGCAAFADASFDCLADCCCLSNTAILAQRIG